MMLIPLVGRFFTRNKTLVAVHLSKVEEAAYQGHELRLAPPWKDNRVFYWDEKGDCRSIFGTVDSVSDYDLVRRVDPTKESRENTIECVDCEECRKERKK